MATNNVPIAIVGMACRFSGDSTTPEKLWDLLAEGRSGWSEIPASRFDTTGLYHPNNERTGSTNVQGGHFLDQDPAVFDAPFFNLTAEVASTLDPQFRMTLEVVYEAMESAGISLESLEGSDTSVYAGCMLRDYHDTLARDPDTLPRYFMTSNAATMASNRVSHFYDLRGPSMTVDTGCSTTLTALHLACQNLRSGESSASVVTGASLMLNPDYFTTMSSIGFLSPDGISHAFDERANGYGRGEGVAALILKRLDDAVAARDPIRAIIRATALNQDGKTTTITTPSQAAQEELIRSCYAQAGLNPVETGYVEAHGTGTSVGDPIEIGAIAKGLGRDGQIDQPLLVGSVKTAIGHTEAASGLASIIKVVMGLEKGLLPPNCNFERPSRKLDLAKWGIEIPTTLQQWPLKRNIRRASINNFGFGGANAHVIIEEYKPNLPPTSHSTNGILVNEKHSIGTNGASNGHTPHKTSSKREPFQIGTNVNGNSKRVFTHSLTNGHTVMPDTSMNFEVSNTNGNTTNIASRVFMVSAKDEEGCRQIVARLREHLVSSEPNEPDQLVKDLAFTLGSRRSKLPWVAAHFAGDLTSLRNALDSESFAPVRTPAKPRIGLVFNGQGAQWPAMGRELMQTYPVFQASIKALDGYIKDLGAKWSLIEELSRDDTTSNVHSLVYSLPLCSAIQMALVDLLWSWGIEPVAVTGHSSGEVAAAYAARALDARSAIAIPYLRGALSAETDRILGKGGMMAVGLSRDKTDEYISRVSAGNVTVACVNSQNSITVSGDIPAIEELEQILVEDKAFCRRLRINGAFHSIHMSPISAMYMAELQPLLKPLKGCSTSKVIFSSSMTGARLDDKSRLATPEYWNANMLGVVEFESSFRNMCFSSKTAEGAGHSQDVDLLIEVGPHGSLCGPIQDLLTLSVFAESSISYLNCLVRKKSSVETMQALACALLRKGYPVNLEAVNFPNGLQSARVLPDLPFYPWNHRNRFWLEPRLNKAWRQRNRLVHDILGVYQASANAHTPTWRNFLRTADLPWLRDHVVGANIVFPGAGYMSMAIEAAASLAQQNGQTGDVIGFVLQDVQFVNALIIPDDTEGREVQLTLLPSSQRSLGTRGWHEFRVSSVCKENRWSEHCHGMIQTVYATGKSNSDMRNRQSKLELAKRATPAIYIRQVDPEDIWMAMRSVGISHGDIFRNLTKVVANQSESVATFSIADVSATMPMKRQSEYIVHPTTLDSAIQSAYSVLPGLGTRLATPFIPRSIKRLVLGRHISNSPGHQLETHVRKSSSKKPHSFQVDMKIFDAEPSCHSSSNAVLEFTGLLCQSLDGVSASSVRKDNDISTLCSTLQWAIDLSLETSTQALSHLRYQVDDDEVDMMMKLRQAVFYYVQDAVACLTDTDLQDLEGHHVKHYNWMKTQLSLAAGNKLAPDSSRWFTSTPVEKAMLLSDVAASSVNGEMLQQIGPRIPEILRGRVTTLELMLEGGLLYRYYNRVLKFDRSTHQMAQLVKLLAHKNPRAKILEIGAGTGGGTRAVLDALGREDRDGALFDHYHFTDISPGFFEAARKRFEPWKDLMTFCKLDIELDADQQGLSKGTFDIIIACQVLHATKNMEKTMRNVRQLLKPGGRLVLIETTQDSLDVFLAFGLLPGWWLSEEKERAGSPSLTVPFWTEVLRTTGFTGVDLELRDCEDEKFYNFSVILSTATPEPPVYHSDVLLVCDPGSPPYGWIHKIQSELSNLLGSPPQVCSLGSASFDGKTCIYMGDLKQDATLANLDECMFAGVKKMASTCESLLWVTRGGSMDSKNAEMALSHGMLRTLKHEYQGKTFATLDVDTERPPWTPETVEAIVRVFSTVFNKKPRESDMQDLEYCERQGAIYIPRLFRDNNFDEGPGLTKLIPTETSMETFASADKAVTLHIESQGMLDTLVFVEDTASHTRELLPDSVEIEPRAFGLNFRDIMVAMGQIGIDTLRASECSGIITRLGSDASRHGLKVGDRVCALLQDHWTTRPQTHWTSVAKIPNDMSYEVAAAVPVAFATAYVSLHEVARLQKGETVLIHSAAGGLGQAAIRLCQQAGAVIFATVGSKRKRNFLMETFGIPETHIFSSRDAIFSSSIMERTKGRGIDVVLNSLAGSLLQESFNCLADFGRFVELGKRDFEENSQLDMAAFKRNTTFFSVDLIAWESERQGVVSRVIKEVVRLLESRAIVPPDPINTYPISRIKDAFRSMQTGQHLGKIVITVGDDDLVPLKRKLATPALIPDASYVVVGGMGGIGRSLCEWLVSRGARHIIVLSRSARVDSFFASLDCDIRAVSCDVSDETQLATAIGSCADMPAIRGVLQSAMVLRDSIFEQMTAAEFNAAIAPKVRGSWNLHRLFPDVDFFIMLSSVLGVTGSPGQANYTAAGAYEDALARFRRSEGLSAVCIDLGVVQSVGYVAGNHGISSRLAKNGVGMIHEDEVHHILDTVVCNPFCEQVVTGITFPPVSHKGGADWLRDRRFTPLQPREQDPSRSATVKLDVKLTKLRGLLSREMSVGEASLTILGELSKKIMDMFGTQEIDASKDLAAHGVDSLVAIELRNWLTTQAAIELSVLDLLQSSSLRQLAEHVATQLGHVSKVASPKPIQTNGLENGIHS